MIIKFDDSNLCTLPNFKGGEKEFKANMFFDGTNRIFKGNLAPGASIGFHKHEGSCEMIFVLSGKGTLIEQSEDESSERQTHEVLAGDCLYCPEGHSHSLVNSSEDEDLVFYAAIPKQ